MKKVKPIKALKGLPKETHTSKTNRLGGTYNGTAIKNKVGSFGGHYTIDGYDAKKPKKPPKSLA